MGLLLHSMWDLPGPGIEPVSSVLADTFPATGLPRKSYSVFFFFFFNSNTFLPILVKAKSLIHVRLFATPWTVDYEVPPSMRFSRQEYWSGLPFPSPLAHIRHLVNICLFGPPDLTLKQRTESSIQNMMTKRESNVSPKLEGHGENT